MYYRYGNDNNMKHHVNHVTSSSNAAAADDDDEGDEYVFRDEPDSMSEQGSGKAPCYV